MTENTTQSAGCLSHLTAELDTWQPIETAPKTGRQLILLKTPYSPDGCKAYSNTWWVSGFSVSSKCKPTHWKPLPQTSV